MHAGRPGVCAGTDGPQRTRHLRRQCLSGQGQKAGGGKTQSRKPERSAQGCRGPSHAQIPAPGHHSAKEISKLSPDFGILPMSLPAEASAKAGATAVSPVGFPVHGRAGTALRLAGKMPVPRCAHAARRIIIVYRPPRGRARIGYRRRPDIFRLVARDPILVFSLSSQRPYFVP